MEEDTFEPLKDSEGSTPDSEMNREIEELIEIRNLNFCLECGRCSAICPMKDFYGNYVFERSPRGVVERLLFDPENMDDEALWYCFACQKCTAYCPSLIDFRSVMMELREILLRYGFRKYALFCAQCGRYVLPKPEVENLERILTGEKWAENLSSCPECTTLKCMETIKAANGGGRFRKKGVA
ncbi:MAG: 4Fe-4S dicluster domain-containing protein [Deltaproteobacteria bacterium]|nr:4Fe-4S dicluster domain-containing protein [Deltaproteobacteria bacterium]